MLFQNVIKTRMVKNNYFIMRDFVKNIECIFRFLIGGSLW